MDIGRWLLVGVLALFFLVALGRIFRAPLQLALRLLCSTALGFAALGVLHLAVPAAYAIPGLNAWNALIVGILGLPGLGLLLLLGWIL